ncbi:hypothetical protein PR048_017837 [Dryococelus australis]|uniref:Integrase zinc-binding domain-containing protein n=1 Tax=Dryococelus australis TaxID=614101 RepID=A0ABQ9HAL4_9NEOP|nr:hypothetical protein PR048_017837 [Dryococelus australis]
MDADEQELRHTHNSQFDGHPEALQTTRNVQTHFHSPRATRDMSRYMRECITCNYFKSCHAVPNEPFERISLDFMDPYPRTAAGNA